MFEKWKKCSDLKRTKTGIRERERHTKKPLPGDKRGGCIPQRVSYAADFLASQKMLSRGRD